MTRDEMTEKLKSLGFTNQREINDVIEMLGEHGEKDQAIILDTMPAYGDVISFSGQNCEDEGYDDTDLCAGWDGFSRRCMCGNRRVSWVVEGTYAYGEAY